MTRHIILICGKAQHGKSTVARYLGLPVFPFAKPLKELASKYFKWDGEKDLLGRWILVQLGKLIRTVNINYFVHSTINEIQNSSATVIAIDDWRFPNEYNQLFYATGVHITTVRVIRPDIPAIDDESETSLDNVSTDFVIQNDGDLGDLREKVLDLQRKLKLI